MKAAERETKGPKTDSGIFLPATRRFMDDLTVTTSSHIQARWILSVLEEVFTWAWMKFKPMKSRSMILRKGQITTKFQLKIQGDEIPTIVDNPIKCLGKWFDDTLKDNTSVKTVQTQVVEWLKKVDKSGLPGKFKAWIYQHGLLPRLTWLLMIYEMTATTVESIERKINSHLRRWLGVPPSFTALGLHSRSSQLQLPLTSSLEEYKVSKSRLVMTLRDSKDSKISKAGIQTRTGRKWSARTAVDQAESILHHKDIVGNTCTGCKVALTQGRYQWRHDKVLNHLAEILNIERRKKRPSKAETKQIRFVREGDMGHATKSQQHFILDKGSEWNMRADIGKKLVFQECVQTTLRLDIVVWSQPSKMIVAIGLTVPWEERCEEAYQQKKEKYTELMTTCRERGWKAWLFPVEVGCRGFPAQSVWRMLQAMGIVRKARKTAVRQLGEAAERSTCWLWHRRDDLSWKTSADE
ncbi:Hypothetical predicted protein [Mytilus galloprovincialis]|uniref:Reverse transcriptase domain-containing protein n=1 Tax=Mytilus galloprovincialis TaxID=29158 RepID=A0A8B6DQ66_MYTGA|nr:Hypothetical predicted protein [Mytilus galloprovincialis]